MDVLKRPDLFDLHLCKAKYELEWLCDNLVLLRKVSVNFKGRGIAIWGTHRRGKLARKILEHLGIECQFFVSSRPESTNCCGIPLFTPDKLDASKHYVIVCTPALVVEQFLMQQGFNSWANRDYVRLRLWHDDLEYDGCLVGRGSYGYTTLKEDGGLGSLVHRIGRYCSINYSAQVVINHPTNYVSPHPFLYLRGFEPFNQKIESKILDYFYDNALIDIGNDVWIGANVVILPGVKIGDGAILGTGAVVTHDIEPYAIVGGVPARVIKYRYPKNIIESLLKIKWWNWPINKIEENYELFHYPELFCKVFDSLSSE